MNDKKQTRFTWQYWDGTKGIRQKEIWCDLPQAQMCDEHGLARMVTSYDSAGKLVSQEWFAADGARIATTNIVVFGETVPGKQAEELGIRPNDVCCRLGSYSIANCQDWDSLMTSLDLQGVGRGDNRVCLMRQTDGQYRVLEVKLRPEALGVQLADKIVSVRQYREMLKTFQEHLHDPSKTQNKTTQNEGSR